MGLFIYTASNGKQIIRTLTYVLVYAAAALILFLGFESLVRSVLQVLTGDDNGLLALPVAVLTMFFGGSLPWFLHHYAALMEENNELIDALKQVQKAGEHWRERYYGEHKEFRDRTLRYPQPPIQ